MGKVNRLLTIPTPGRVEIVERPYPRIKRGFLLVRALVTPMCTEYLDYKSHQFDRGTGPETTGHKGVGEVVEVCEGSRFHVGDRVIVWDGEMCGECWPCRQGLSPAHCVNKGFLSPEGMHAGIQKACDSESGGFGFSQYTIAPENMAMSIPDGLDYKYAAAAGCFCGATYSALEELRVRAGEWLLVGGVGFMGLGAIINAKYRNAKVIALGRNEYRMGLCRQMGVEHILDPEDSQWHSKVLEITGFRHGVDSAYEGSGYPYYQRKCMKALGQYGRMYFAGYVPQSNEKLPIHVETELISKHVTLTGGHDMAARDRQAHIEMLRDKEVQRMIDISLTHRMGWSRAKEAFELALSKKCGKIDLLPWE